ncbi:ParB N-terminal domain-containing protein [Streptomyces sp. NPDC007100]|uniref:winged helix-turn-helix transcriptional regulator n=1 Tax=Streptomyces sp. NPDC007100 TaxID=3155602 RepID=UPI0033F676C1
MIDEPTADDAWSGTPAGLLAQLVGDGLSLPGRTEKVPVASLLPADSPRTDGERDAHATLLAECGAPLPPIVVQRSTMRVVDGMHRLRAATLRGETEIEVCFFDGDEKDAFVLAVQANVAHGLPLSLAERKRAAARIIRSHPQWSDRAIGTVTGLNAKTVGVLRQPAGGLPPLRVRVGRDGRARPVDGAEGRRRASELIAENPQTPLREIAKAAGISLGTVSDVRKRLLNGEDPLPPRQRSADGQQRHREAADPAGPRADAEASHAAGRERIAMLHKLRKDPSLRFTDAGRALLRWLDVQATENQEWERVLAGVPSHCRETVAELARTCARMWQEFAVQLEQREPASV